MSDTHQAHERSVEAALRILTEDPEVLKKMRDDPIKTLQELRDRIPRRALEHDRFIYRTVITVLGSISLLTVVSAIYLTILKDGEKFQFPEILTALASASIGALAGILAPLPKN